MQVNVEIVWGAGLRTCLEYRGGCDKLFRNQVSHVSGGSFVTDIGLISALVISSDSMPPE
jgi:hypothetical protein